MVPRLNKTIVQSVISFLHTVATGFPAGQTPLKTRLDEIHTAIADGASEIDIVINRQLALSGDWQGKQTAYFSYFLLDLCFVSAQASLEYHFCWSHYSGRLNL